MAWDLAFKTSALSRSEMVDEAGNSILRWTSFGVGCIATRQSSFHTEYVSKISFYLSSYNRFCLRGANNNNDNNDNNNNNNNNKIK